MRRNAARMRTTSGCRFTMVESDQVVDAADSGDLAHACSARSLW